MEIDGVIDDESLQSEGSDVNSPPMATDDLATIVSTSLWNQEKTGDDYSKELYLGVVRDESPPDSSDLFEKPPRLEWKTMDNNERNKRHIARLFDEIVLDDPRSESATGNHILCESPDGVDDNPDSADALREITPTEEFGNDYFQMQHCDDVVLDIPVFDREHNDVTVDLRQILKKNVGEAKFQITVNSAEKENSFIHDHENIVQTTVNLNFQKSDHFQVSLDLYGRGVNHPGNKQSCYCKIDIFKSCNQEDVYKVMTSVIEYNIGIENECIYFTCPSAETAKKIIDNAYSEGKLAPGNCHYTPVNTKKWDKMREGQQILYYARQYLGGQHGSNGTFKYPLYIPLMEIMENKLRELFGYDFSIQQAWTDEFKTSYVLYPDRTCRPCLEVWREFTRYKRERLWTGKEGPTDLYVLCLKQSKNGANMSP